jgi:hypothetical protein
MPLPKFRRGSSDELKRHGCMNNVPQAEAGDVSASRIGLLAVVRLPPFRELIPAGAGGERWPEQPGWSEGNACKAGAIGPQRDKWAEGTGPSLGAARTNASRSSTPGPSAPIPSRRDPIVRLGISPARTGNETPSPMDGESNAVPSTPGPGRSGTPAPAQPCGVLLRAWAWLADTLALFVFALLKALRRSRG